MDANHVHIINLIALQKLPTTVLREHFGKYALLHAGEIIGYFNTNREALHASGSYDHGQVSIQLVDDQPSDLGFVDCENS